MGATVKLTLTDERVFVGKLHCLDDSCNFIINHCSFLVPLKGEETVHTQQDIGQVLIRSEHVVKVEVKKAEVADEVQALLA
jgi:small nuclear ribonucleoprotein (snRNP)-like protein